MLFREQSTPAGSGPDGFRTGAGAVLTLIGVGLTVWRMPSTPGRGSGRSLPAVAHAALAGLIAAVLAVLGGLPLLMACCGGRTRWRPR